MLTIILSRKINLLSHKVNFKLFLDTFIEVNADKKRELCEKVFASRVALIFRELANLAIAIDESRLIAPLMEKYRLRQPARGCQATANGYLSLMLEITGVN